MANMVARIRVVIDVPYSFDLPDSNSDEDQVLTARADAARFAEKDLVEILRESIKSHGTIIDELVEEVRDAE